MSNRPNRNDLPTPGWRVLDQTDIKAMVQTQEQPQSDDSEDDETFIRSNQTISAEERERWTGYSIKKLSAASKGSQSRSSKRNRSAQPRTTEAIFPTPMESFFLVHEAKRIYLERQGDSTVGDDARRQLELRQNLANFMDSLNTFASIEECLHRQKEHMMGLLEARNVIAGGESARRSGSKSPNGVVSDDANIETPSKRHRKNSSGVSGPNDNFLLAPGSNGIATYHRERGRKKDKPPLDVAIMQMAVTKLESIEKAFSDNSSTLFDTLKELLEQAKLDAPATCSFISLKRRFQDASNSATCQMRDQYSTHRLSELIKSQIDSGKYPIIAETFELNENYRLDGCDPRKGWKNEPKPISPNGFSKKGSKCEVISEPETNPASAAKEKLKSYGFSIDPQALNSDDEDDGPIVNPLLGEAWHNVRKRLERKRKRAAFRRVEGCVDLDDGLPLLPEAPHVEINISVHSTPTSIAGARGDPIHPSDRALLTERRTSDFAIVRRIVEFEGDDLVPLSDEEQIKLTDDAANGFLESGNGANSTTGGEPSSKIAAVVDPSDERSTRCAGEGRGSDSLEPELMGGSARPKNEDESASPDVLGVGAKERPTMKVPSASGVEEEVIDEEVIDSHAAYSAQDGNGLTSSKLIPNGRAVSTDIYNEELEDGAVPVDEQKETLAQGSVGLENDVRGLH